jgi:hypothetical protein
MPKGVYPRTSGIPHQQVSGLAKIMLPPLPQHPLVPETAEEMLLTLAEHLEALAKPREYSVYSTDFARFLKERVWTRDEARGGRVARFPDYAFLQDLCDDLLTEPKLMVEKSRRVLATWTACAFDVWIAAGGQDPRWPALMNARGNRQVFLIHQKFEDAEKVLRTRTWHIIEQLEERGIREVWPDFPRWTRKEGELAADNGSYITGLPEGSNQTRGPGATLLHVEELAFLNNAKALIEGALPTLRGGGHIVAISTANASSYAKLLVEGSLRSGW